MEYTYGRKFSGNILVVGKRDCGKATFGLKLYINNFFG